MEKQKPVPYELRQRSKHYVGLWQGKHCICSICTNTERGKLDAQFLLEACDGREALLEQRKALLVVCEDAKSALYDAIHTEDFSKNYCENIMKRLELVIKKVEGK